MCETIFRGCNYYLKNKINEYGKHSEKYLIKLFIQYNRISRINNLLYS